MIRASLYVIGCSARNRFRSRLRRLREPRYWLGAIAALAYLYFSLFGVRDRGRPASSRRRGAGAPAAIVGAVTASGPILTASLLALATAIAGALVLTWTEKKFPEVQEAIIGVTFVLAATAALILLSSNPHGAEHMKDILVGQILWVSPEDLLLQGVISAIILTVWFSLGARIGRIGFYVLFACAVTMSPRALRPSRA